MKVQYLFARRKIVWIVLFAVLAVFLLTAATTNAAPEQSCGFYHHVHFGQTLASIGRYYGVSVTALMHANPHIKNPNVIYAGSKIYIPCGKPPGHPGTGGPGYCRHKHYVQYGQTLSQIAYHYHVPPYKIMQANGLHNPDLIYAGTYLCIP